MLVLVLQACLIFCTAASRRQLSLVMQRLGLPLGPRERVHHLIQTIKTIDSLAGVAAALREHASLFKHQLECMRGLESSLPLQFDDITGSMRNEVKSVTGKFETDCCHGG